METDTLKSAPSLQAPKCMKFYSGGFFGSSLRLEWDGSNLYRQKQNFGGSDLRHCSWVCLSPPSAQAWSELRQVLDEHDVWKWPCKSTNPDVMDGRQWDLGFVWGTREWAGSGCNAYPLGFTQVERVLERLAKGRRAPGFPARFVIQARREQEEVRFEWDGRRLQWWYWAAGRGCSSEGEQGRLPSAAWKEFNRAFSNARHMGLLQGHALEGYPSDRGDSSLSCFDLDMSTQPLALWQKMVRELAGLSGLTLSVGLGGACE
jgi:hypothetical protein